MENLLEKLSSETRLKIRLLLSRSTKYGLAGLDEEIEEVSNNPEILKICDKKNFLAMFYSAHSEIVIEEMKRRQ